MDGTRPLGVTAVGWLVSIAGFFAAMLGAFAIFDGWDVDPPWLPWTSLAGGIVLFVTSWGLTRGNNVARIVATVVLSASVVQAVLVLVQAPDMAASAAVSLLVPVVGILLLYTPKANDFFRR